MMISNQRFQAILDLDLEQIKAKLMQVGHGEAWSKTKADIVEIEYRRFLYLAIAFPDERKTPLEDVDTFWHYHILDTMKYAADCEAAFGHFLHHFPYSGLRGEEDAAAHQMSGQRMHVLYEEIFGASYAEAERAMTQAGNAKSAYCMIGPVGAKPDMAADSAYCMIGPIGSEPAKAAKQAYCMIGPVGARPDTAANSAYCMIGPVGSEPAKAAKQAYCMIGPVGAKPDTAAKQAYCMIGPVGAKPDTAAKQAYCMIGPIGAKPANAAKSAYCMIGPIGAKPGKAANSAYCMIGAVGATPAETALRLTPAAA
jgi:hypothetical protein